MLESGNFFRAEWPSSLLSCAIDVKLGSVRSTFEWVTFEVLAKHLAPLPFGNDINLWFNAPAGDKAFPFDDWHIKHRLMTQWRFPCIEPRSLGRAQAMRKQLDKQRK